MNAIYLCAIAHPWIEVSKKLASEYNIKPCYFVHWQSDKKEYFKSSLKNCYLQSLEDAWKGLGFPSDIDRYIFDEEELKSIAYYELIALKMMERLDPDGQSFPFTTRLYFFRDLLGYWFNVIESREIDLVISPSIPHRVFDYALYVVCKMRNIKFVMFQLTPFGSNSILIDDIDAMPIVAEDKTTRPIPSESIQRKIAEVQGDYSKAIPSYMRKHEDNSKRSYTLSPLPHVKKLLRSYRLTTSSPNTYWIENGFSPNETKYSWNDFYAMQAKRNKMVSTFVQFYERITVADSPEKFILVALHYQPEETSCPTGGAYSDQILMIQLLNQYLPDDITIIVKEHKTQFYSHVESASGRSLLFYRRIAQISSRIKFVSVDYDPFKLIDQAQAVVTISGTIGWESAIRGTPTLTFGRAWYEGMPRVFKVKTKADLVDALPQLPEQKNKDLQDTIMRFHAALEDNFIHAKHYKAYLNNDDVTMEKSVTNIVNYLGRVIN